MAKEALTQIGPREITGKRIVVLLVGLLTPRAYRERFKKQVIVSYTTFPNACVAAARAIIRANVSKAVEAFSGSRFVGDMSCICIAFSILPPLTLLALLGVAGLVLSWRNGYTDPAEGAADAAFDGITLAVAILVWQLILSAMASPFSMDLDTLALHLPAAVAMVVVWRVVFQMKDPMPRPSDVLYKTALRVNLIWFSGYITLIRYSGHLLPDAPGYMYYVKFWWALITFLSLPLSQVTRSDSLGPIGLRAIRYVTISLHPEEGDLDMKQNRLAREGAHDWIAFVLLTFPLVLTLFNVLTGKAVLGTVDWMLIAETTAIYFILLKMWGEVKEINHRARLAMQADKEALAKTVAL